MARPKGIEVFIDGAHSFAHFPFTRDELDCDYFATSLHKWLLAPIGTGMLYVRKSKIKSIWPLMAAGASQTGETSGSTRRSAPTRPPTTTPSARPWRSTGASATSGRPRGCDTSATDGPSRSWPPARRSRSGRPLDDDSASCGITLVDIEGIEPGEARRSPDGQARHPRHRAIGHKDFPGIRVTPNIYTTPGEIDTFGEALHRVLAEGLS